MHESRRKGIHQRCHGIGLPATAGGEAVNAMTPQSHNLTDCLGCGFKRVKKVCEAMNPNVTCTSLKPHLADQSRYLQLFSSDPGF